MVMRIQFKVTFRLTIGVASASTDNIPTAHLESFPPIRVGGRDQVEDR